jgi:trehalose/maltose hydrolase-like predicted phosphorylase
MTISSNLWSVTETDFKQEKIHHRETIFTLGNGYLGTRGAFEEAFPDEVRSTFLHGVFDNVPLVFTELVNAPDWLELEIILAGERFRLDQGELLAFTRTLDLKTACLRRDLRWRSPRGHETRLVFERFASLADRHLCAVRVRLTPENYTGRIEVRAGLNGDADNLGVKHWDWLGQELRGNAAWLRCCTRATRVELVAGQCLTMLSPSHRSRLARWDIRNHPTLVTFAEAGIGETVTCIKWVTYHTSREGREPLKRCLGALRSLARLEWEMAWEAHCQAWNAEWEQCDVVIEGDEDAQLALRFNLFQLLTAAPRSDERVNIGAKTLSGYGYRGHAFWDTEIFMLPFFTYTRPEIAYDLLSYRWHNLAGAHKKALANGFRGAQYPWESAGTGEEVTPAWVPDPLDRTKIIRIWGGDIEIHISADIAYAIWQYWQATGDEAFLLERGAEIILDTARFWGSRVEWNPDRQRFEINDIIGPDEYHDRVDNNIFTNALARWNLQTALDLAAWMKETYPVDWRRLNQRLQLKDDEFRHWKEVIDRIYLAFDPMTKLIEQFEGYFQRKDIDLVALEPRTQSVQALFGIEGINTTQVIKQPDVLMLMYLLPRLYPDETLRANYAYYTARTDYTFGSSLGLSIQAIMACRVDDPSAYEHFMRAAHADLFDVRNNAGDGIHGASAGGLWQAVVFGFAGLEHTSNGWQVHPRLPSGWTRLAFRIVDHGHVIKFDIKP